MPDQPEVGDFVAFEMAAADALFEGVHGAVAFVLRFLEREEAFALAGVEGDWYAWVLFLSVPPVTVCALRGIVSA